ncbi:conserved hypothetical protein [Alteracholeplasma palmae J233]|uniref:Uncharacterized protein n=1 Tax=Alteracholeplasma palmae (strain ATCC 49389 / J233) TaxID=1318466 RepID=U4KK95_ALTPJ|nr:hypothetical protein [Alteracholeplasma palmae]CCV64114.1 conserved hypothetical protein [Alteracholeplasma palmae J233]
MKLSSIFKTGVKTTKAKVIAILVPAFIITATIAFLTFYGQNTGNFSINIDESAQMKNISIATSPLSKDNQKIVRVSSNPITPISSESLVSTKLPEIKNNESGMYHSRNFIAQTFYIKNESETLSVTLSYHLIITEVAKQKITSDFKLHPIIRVMIIDGETENIFEPNDSNDEMANKKFNEGSLIINEKSAVLNAKQERKYIFIMWYDLKAITPETKEPPALKFQLNFKTEEE